MQRGRQLSRRVTKEGEEEEEKGGRRRRWRRNPKETTKDKRQRRRGEKGKLEERGENVRALVTLFER